ncbi:MAG: CHAT domain-containing tetratricopeptide repeat protein [Bryobacteraceae bacterium]
MPLLATQADYNIAYLYFLRGDYGTALDQLRATRELCSNNHDQYHSALCDLDQSEIYLELNLIDEAARMASEARDNFSKLGMSFEEGKSIVNLAIATHRKDDRIQALELFSDARKIFKRENNEAWRALTDLYKAVVLIGTGYFDQARRVCKRALRFFESTGLERRAVLCQLLLVRIDLMTGRLRHAAKLCTVAIQRVKSVDAPLLTFQTHLLMGHAQLGVGAPHAAYDFYQKARLELEALRTSVQGDELKIAFMKDKLDVYERLVDLCLREPVGERLEQAFDFMEQAKSRSLIDLIFGRGMPMSWQIPEEELRPRIASVRGDLNWYYHRIEIEQTRPEGVLTERISQLRQDANDLEDQFLRLVRELPNGGASGSAYYARHVMSLEQIRSALPDDAALVEYFEVDRKFLVAVITLASIIIIPLAGVPEVTTSLQMLEFQMSRVRISGFSEGQSEHLKKAVDGRLNELYNQVFAPVASHISASQLIVIPHGVLHYLPFHALWDGRKHLIDHFAISYAPSSSVYAACHARNGNDSGPSLLLGIHDEHAPWIEREIRSVAAVVPEPLTFLGERATSQVLREEGPGSRFIHIATHGNFRHDNPMFSNVRLADGYLSLYDLYQMKLPVELLTLSGCGTGLSVIAPGDELQGLTRGLLYAGARAALVTLWDVHDQTSAEFMRLFYSSLIEQSDKSLALRAAMLELRESFPHPYYWAPFVLVGKIFHPRN